MIEFKKEYFADNEIARSLYNADVDMFQAIEDFLKALISLYEISQEGDTLVSTLAREWNIFAADEGLSASRVLSLLDIPLHADDRVRYIPEIGNCLDLWENVKTEVKTNKRFFCDLTPIEDLITNFVPVEFTPDTHFYRARVHHQDEAAFVSSKMGCPTERQNVSAGRANPRGIPYLYLCTDDTTPVYEIRPTYLDRVDIGEFVLVTDRIKVIDFTQSIELFNVFNEEGKDTFKENVMRKVLFEAISRDLSNPLHSYDSDLEYIPTQLICEYYKNLDYDGVMYVSSVHRTGKNLVLFNPDIVRCDNVRSYEVHEITIRKQLI